MQYKKINISNLLLPNIIISSQCSLCSIKISFHQIKAPQSDKLLKQDVATASSKAVTTATSTNIHSLIKDWEYD